MYLKNYQTDVVKALHAFLAAADAERQRILPVLRQFPDMRNQLDWVRSTFTTLQLPQPDAPKTGLDAAYPRLVIKVPTGGGKTLLAVEAIREYQNTFAKRRTGLVVWIVPSETIYTQTVGRLKDRRHALRQLLDQCSGGHTLILEKGQRLTAQDIAENLVVLFVMIQSISRTNAKEGLKVFQDSGGCEGFFPADNRYDLHRELLKETPNLDVISGADSMMPQVRTSLANAIRIAQPLIIVDELHKVFSEGARRTLDSLNPALVLGFSATPKREMNILISISGLRLKEEEMIKLDLHIHPPRSKEEKDWKAMLHEITQHRDRLETEAITYKERTGMYIRPIALIQAERTGKDQRTGSFVHSLDVRDALIETGVPADHIAIKTSAQNDIEDVDLLSPETPIRYIITRDALREGWDCPFAYVLGIIPNLASNTGITQLVGRILRQPYARKTGVEALDESYVYYAQGDTGDLLTQVSAGFKAEGLEDLLGGIKEEGNNNLNKTKRVRIKPELAAQYGNALYLSLWLIVEDDAPPRKFSYAQDILSRLDFRDYQLSDDALQQIADSLGEARNIRTVMRITLNEESHMQERYEREAVPATGSIHIAYLTRRLTEVVENSFTTRKVAEALLAQLQNKIGSEQTAQHFGFITAELVKELAKERDAQEEAVFLRLLQAGKLVLAVSDAEATGYAIPAEDIVPDSRAAQPFSYYLYEDADLSTINGLEREVSKALDGQSKTLWWFRNKTGSAWYAIQGWKRDKVRPDFVAAKKRIDGSLDLVYVIEAKGNMLLGNDDTTYKAALMDTMNHQQVKTYQSQLSFDTLNESVVYYMAGEGDEVRTIQRLMR